jgi:acyl-CoA thioester hydrolase
MNNYSFSTGGIWMLKSYIENIEKWREEFSFYVPIKVRFSDTDMYGHLNNTVPIVYFEQARIDFFNHLGLMEDWTDQDVNNIPVVADIQCDYLKQVYFNEPLKVYAKIAKIGSSSVDLHYLGVDHLEQICFTGRGTIVQINQNNGKSASWTEKQLEKLSGSKK